MEKRIGVVGVVIENLESSEKVNEILHEYAYLFLGRMGIPCRERGVAVITLIVDGTNDEISALTGKIGKIKNVTVKSMITKQIGKQ